MNVDPNKDFELYFSNKDIHKPEIIIEKHPELED